MKKTVLALTAASLVVAGGIAFAQMEGMDHGNMAGGSMEGMAMMDHSALIPPEFANDPATNAYADAMDKMMADMMVPYTGDPDVDFGAISLNAEFDLGDSITAYAFSAISNRDITSFAFFRAPNNTAQNIRSIYPDGFLPQIFNTSTDVSFSNGIKTSTDGGTNIDIGYTFGSNELEFDIRNTLNRSLGPTSPTQFYAGSLELKQHVLNFDFNKQLDWGFAYPLTLSYGAEWRGEKFTTAAT